MKDTATCQPVGWCASIDGLITNLPVAVTAAMGDILAWPRGGGGTINQFKTLSSYIVMAKDNMPFTSKYFFFFENGNFFKAAVSKVQ